MESKIKIKKEQIEDYAVQKTGDETIDGRKNFTTSPRVPHTSDTSTAVNLEQTRSEITTKIAEITLQKVVQQGSTATNLSKDLIITGDGNQVKGSISLKVDGTKLSGPTVALEAQDIVQVEAQAQVAIHSPSFFVRNPGNGSYILNKGALTALTSQSQTNSLIANDASGKALITKEYLEEKISGTPSLDTVLTAGNTSEKSIILEKATETNDLAISADGFEFANYGNDFDNLTLKWTTSGDGQLLGTEIELPKKSGTLAVVEDIEIGDASATQSGIVNNTPLQELGGKDKLINGVRVGQGNTTDLESTALGVAALANDTGGYNTAIGYEALKNNTSGYANVAVGDWASIQNTQGSFNSSIGAGALELNQFGSGNVAIGSSALRSNIGTSGSNMYGHRSVAVGANAMYSNTTGNGTAIGNFALTNQTTGTWNIAIGSQAGSGITTGNNNVVLAGTGFIAPGGGITTGSNNLIVAQNNGNTTGITTGSGNTIIGKTSGLAPSLSNTVILSDGIGNIALKRNENGLTTAPSQTDALIDTDTTGKAIVTKEYLQSKTNSATTLTAAATVILTADKNVNYFANTGGAVTWTLPPVSGNTGKQIIIVNKGTDTITLNTNSTDLELFDGAETNGMPLMTGATYGLFCDGTHWVALY